MQRFVLTSFLTLILTFLTFAQDISNDAKKLWAEGKAKYNAGDYKAAVDLFDQALAIDKYYEIHYDKAVSLVKLKKYNEAVSAFDDALAMKPDLTNAKYYKGSILYVLADYTQALNVFTDILTNTPNYPNIKKVQSSIANIHNIYAANSLKDGKYTEAIANADKALEYAQLDKAYLNKAIAYTELAQWDNALDAAFNAMKVRSKVSKGEISYYLGMAYKNKGDLTKAKEYFEAAKTDSKVRQRAEYELSVM